MPKIVNKIIEDKLQKHKHQMTNSKYQNTEDFFTVD